MKFVNRIQRQQDFSDVESCHRLLSLSLLSASETIRARAAMIDLLPETHRALSVDSSNRRLCATRQFKHCKTPTALPPISLTGYIFHDEIEIFRVLKRIVERHDPRILCVEVVVVGQRVAFRTNVRNLTQRQGRRARSDVRNNTRNSVASVRRHKRAKKTPASVRRFSISPASSLRRDNSFLSSSPSEPCGVGK